jgi:hypothetical protein
MFEDSDVQKFFEPPRALHIYGAIRSIAAPPLPFWPDHRRDPTSLAGDQISDYQMKFKELLDEAYVASQGLRVIDPHDKHANKEIIETAQKQLAQAKCVYILGYGFDDNNNRRLDLRTHLAHEYNANKSVYFTNLGDINRVNKRASKVLYGRDDQIFTGSPLVLRPGGGCVYERSVRNVYEALELDFEGFE